VGTPFVSLLYFIFFTLRTPGSDSSEGFRIVGFKTFVIVSDDVSVSAVRINVVLFVHITLPLDLTWFWVQVWVRRPALLPPAGIVPDA
jgi:hypothetical protein